MVSGADSLSDRLQGGAEGRARNFPGYRAQIVAFLVARVSHANGGALDHEAVWKRQGVTDQFISLLAPWAPAVELVLREPAGRQNITQLCKQPGGWDAVRDADMPLPLDLPSELVGNPGR